MGQTRLVPADETLYHQAVSSFAATESSDPRWTEKIWVSIHDIPSGYQLTLGVGKYPNRGVVDGFAGLALGNDQWAVRASRKLSDRKEDTEVGPIRYEVVEPLKQIRLTLERGVTTDFSFDVVMTQWTPPGMEARWPTYSSVTGALTSDVIRYHQCGTASGWLEHRGQKVVFAPDSPAFRDHSWGIRSGIGKPLTGVVAEQSPRSRYRLWAPFMLERADGTRYSLHLSLLRELHDDGSVTNLFDGGEESETGGRRDFLGVIPHLEFDPRTRRLLGGYFDAIETNGRSRRLTVAPARATGFHIGMGGYYHSETSSHYLGQWHGDEWSDVVEAVGTDRTDTVAKVHQTRDVLCLIDDPEVGGSGYGLIETIVVGPFPELGLE